MCVSARLSYITGRNLSIPILWFLREFSLEIC